MAFDAYAKFYEHSMKLLAYRAHEMLVSALVAVHESRKEHVWSLLTRKPHRLMADALEKIDLKYKNLTCIDISPEMLKRARSKAAYTEFIEGDWESSLERIQHNSVDLLVAADVMPYLSRLERSTRCSPAIKCSCREECSPSLSKRWKLIFPSPTQAPVKGRTSRAMLAIRWTRRFTQGGEERGKEVDASMTWCADGRSCQTAGLRMKELTWTGVAIGLGLPTQLAAGWQGSLTSSLKQ
eukprot:751711-Hanusia_phi.AAC.8